MTDYFVLAEGRVDRHVKGLARRIIDELAAVGLKPMHVEGSQTGEWIALDFWHVIIHLFTPAARDMYRLEGAWPKATIIDIPIDTSHEQEDDFE
jgi:ribosome-associated protein